MIDFADPQIDGTARCFPVFGPITDHNPQAWKVQVMKVMVTGGAGFIGNHLVTRLVDMGYDVVVLDTLLRGNKLDKDVLEKVELVQGDVRDWDVVSRAAKGCDYLYHYAAVLGVDIVADNPVETMEVETAGLANVARAAMLHGAKKVVYASTSGVYGKRAIEQAVDEEFEVSPNSSYSIAKRYNEIYLKSLCQEKQLESISIRYFNVYGPKQDQRMVMAKFFRQALEGKPITVFGTGKQTRDFTYIDDVVDATIRVAESVRGCQVFNLSHGQETTIHRLGVLIRDMCRSTSEVTLIDAPKGRYDFEVERRIGDSSKLRSFIGDFSVRTLEEGMRTTMEYYLDHWGLQIGSAPEKRS